MGFRKLQITPSINDLRAVDELRNLNEVVKEDYIKDKSRPTALFGQVLILDDGDSFSIELNIAVFSYEASIKLKSIITEEMLKQEKKLF